jgi:uncharacterized protein YjiS (DUF1127 family)
MTIRQKLAVWLRDRRRRIALERLEDWQLKDVALTRSDVLFKGRH